MAPPSGQRPTASESLRSLLSVLSAKPSRFWTKGEMKRRLKVAKHVARFQSRYTRNISTSNKKDRFRVAHLI
jgi:hypothetical protein